MTLYRLTEVNPNDECTRAHEAHRPTDLIYPDVAARDAAYLTDNPPTPLKKSTVVGPVEFTGPLSDAEALTLVRVSPETRSGNASSLSRIPSLSERATWRNNEHWGGSAINPVNLLRQQVTGNFAGGSTDMLLQWAARKWGLDEDLVRAAAVKESWWRQPTAGDYRLPSEWPADKQPPAWTKLDPATGKHAQSYGLFQLKVIYLGWYMNGLTWYSAAFNADTYCAKVRATMQGHFPHLQDPARTRPGYRTYNDPATPFERQVDSMGNHFSGGYNDVGAVEYLYGHTDAQGQYHKGVMDHYQEKRWLEAGWAE